MKSVMSNRFAQVPKANIPRSSFDRSHGYKTTFDSGYLIPIFVDEALPGDTHKVRMTALARMATPIYPIMDNVFIDTFFFAVPNRLLWDNWEKFNGAQDKPGDSVDYLVPTITAPTGGFEAGSIADYFGIPTGIDNLEVSALPFRAYNLIYNEWFRDQNLQDPLLHNTDDGPDDPARYGLMRRGKRHDYFTSCLPWPQKGERVDIPIGVSAPVNIYGTGTQVNLVDTADPTGPLYAWIQQPINQHYMQTQPEVSERPLNLGFSQVDHGLSGVADLSGAAAASINQLRQAFQIQKLLERDARGGTRYTEILKAHFGVTSPDHRLQRPEYLGGGSTPVNVSQVEQTSASEEASPQGNLAAYATAVPRNGFTQSFTEHCTLIGLVSVRADLTYQQGLERMWSRQTRYDFFWPALAMIGEQAVLNKEIYAQGTSDDDGVFGYQERYGEYRYKPSKITGLFRSSHPQSLDAWHLSQDFAALPVLGNAFIVDNPPMDRVLAVPSEPDWLFDSYFSYRCVRPMPTYGVPGLIDHF